MIEEMAQRAGREEYGNTPAQRGAFVRGYLAWYAEKPIESCPYPDTRKDDGRLTFSRSFIRAWEAGWRRASLEYLRRRSV